MKQETVSRFLALLLIGSIFFSLFPQPASAQEAFPVAPQSPIGQAFSTFLPLIHQTPFFYKNIFGVNTEWVGSPADLDSLVAAGTGWMRRGSIRWDWIEPVKGQRDWSSLEGLERDLVLFSQNNIRMILIVRGVPDWARRYPASYCGPVKREELSSFASFVAELVSRYSQPPYNVHFWEIQNEPDVPVIYTDEPYGCWGDYNDPYYGGKYYGEMLKVVTPKVRAADPGAQILVGGLVLDCNPDNPPIVNGQPKNCNISNYLEGIILGGGAPYFDGVSFHSYDYYWGVPGQFSNPNWHSSSTGSGSVLNAKAQFVQQVLARYQISGKYLVLSEISLLCSNGCDSNFEMTKAFHLIQAYADSIRLGIRAATWYDLYGHWRNSGLFTDGGGRLPAFSAYQIAYQEVGNARFERDLSQPGLKVYQYYNHQGGFRVWVAWSLDGAARTINLPKPAQAVWDAFGNPLPAGSQVQVEVSPKFIEFSP